MYRGQRQATLFVWDPADEDVASLWQYWLPESGNYDSLATKWAEGVLESFMTEL
jgi:hypothetical protein